MPEINFYLDEGDKIDLMSFVFSEGGCIIPNLRYEKASFPLIKSIEEYKLYVNRSLLFFIVHDSYSRESLTWEKFNKEGKELFYIPQRYGGPTIDFYSPGKIEKDGIPFIGPGSVSYYPSYYSIVRGAKMDAPEAQKVLYKKISKEIKKGFAIKPSKRRYWVGLKAIQNLRMGYKLIDVDDDIQNDFLRCV